MAKKIETFYLIRAKHKCCGDIAHAFILKDYKKNYKYSDMVLSGIKRDIKLGHTFEEYRYMVGVETNTVLKTELIPAGKSAIVKEAIKKAEKYEGKSFSKNLQK